MTMSREIHPPATTHISISLVLAYYLLQIASTACSIPKDWKGTKYTGGHGLPALRDSEGLVGPPRPTRNALPPPLHTGLQLDSVTAEWENATEIQCYWSDIVRCPVSWVSGFSLKTDPDLVNKYWEPYIEQPTGWELRDDRKVKKASKKYGYSPNAVGDKLTLKFDLEQDIQTLGVFFMKSYGDKWENSTSKIVILDGDTSITTHEIQGFHDKETSEMYNEEVQFAKPLRKFQIQFEHKAGQTFNLMGLAVCT